jgi:hypothetical protein
MARYMIAVSLRPRDMEVGQPQSSAKHAVDWVEYEVGVPVNIYDMTTDPPTKIARASPTTRSGRFAVVWTKGDVPVSEIPRPMREMIEAADERRSWLETGERPEVFRVWLETGERPEVFRVKKRAGKTRRERIDDLMGYDLGDLALMLIEERAIADGVRPVDLDGGAVAEELDELVKTRTKFEMADELVDLMAR